MIEERLASLGITLPLPAAAAGLYRPGLVVGPFLFLSGQLPSENGQFPYQGKVGGELTVEQGNAAARLAALNALAAIKATLGSLDLVAQVARTTVYVASAEGFSQQPQVANGASQLLKDVFGEDKGVGVRTAIGVAELPLGCPVEVELTLLVH